MIELIIIIVLLVAVAVLTVFTIMFRSRWANAIKIIAQLIVDKEALIDKLDTSLAANSKEANDGFIKFLSDSRQAAFDYIEDVQKSVQNYLAAVESQDEDGIITARMELFSHLPEEAETEDKNKG